MNSIHAAFRKIAIAFALNALCTGLAQAQVWNPLPERKCSAATQIGTPPQPGFSLNSHEASIVADHIVRVKLSAGVNSDSSSWFLIKKVQLIPTDGGVSETDRVSAVPPVDFTFKQNGGYADVRTIGEDSTYRVVLYVENASTFASCDSFFVYSVGEISVVRP